MIALTHWGRDKMAANLLNENISILLNISLKFASKVRINNIPALVQTRARRRPGDKQLPETIVVSLLTHELMKEKAAATPSSW